MPYRHAPFPSPCLFLYRLQCLAARAFPVTFMFLAAFVFPAAFVFLAFL